MDKTFEEKKAFVNEVIKKIYDMAFFDGKPLGKDDYKYKCLPPYYKEDKINDLYILSEVHDQQLREPHIFIKCKGIVAKYVYGEWHNIKYKTCQLYIYKDPDYHDTEIDSTRDIINVLIDFMKTNHYYIKDHKTKQTNKFYDNNGNEIIQDKMIDLLSEEYLDTIRVCGLDIKQCDIDALDSFKNIHEFEIYNCSFDHGLKLGNLKVRKIFSDCSSIPSLKIFDYSSFNISLSQCEIESKVTGVLHLGGESLTLDQIDIDYESFFLQTVADKLKFLKIINEKPLTTKDILFITNFYNIEELDIYAQVDNYKFLYKLDNLKRIGDLLYITSHQELEMTKRLRQDSIDYMYNDNKEYFEANFNMQDYLMYQRLLLEEKYRKFYDTIRIPRIAKVKWTDIIKGRDEKRAIAFLNSIRNKPMRLLKLIGTEDEASIIKLKDEHYLEDLGFSLDGTKDKDRLAKYETLIYGPDGVKLLRDNAYIDFSHQKAFLNNKGNILCEFRFRPEMEVTIPEHIRECVIEVNPDNNPNLTKYYEQYHCHDRKIIYIEQHLIELLSKLMIDNKQPSKNQMLIIKKFIHQYKVLTLIREYTDWFDHEYFQIVLHERLSYSEQSNLADACDINSIDDLNVVIERVLASVNYDEQGKLKLAKDINKLYEYQCKKKKIEKNNFSFTKIIEDYFKDCDIFIVNEIDRDNINQYFIDEIDTLAIKHQLSNINKEIFKYYVYYLQERYTRKLQETIKNINARYVEPNQEETSGLDTFLSYAGVDYDNMTIDELLKEGHISAQTYCELCTLDFFETMVLEFENKKENVDIMRIEWLYNHLQELKALQVEDVRKIKSLIPIVDEFSYDKDALYMDQIIKYITGDYPKWIKRDIEKLPIEEPIKEFTKKITQKHKGAKKHILSSESETIYYTPACLKPF